MISIIVSTKNRNLISELTSNVDKTIGVSYELIIIENPSGSFGLAEAYNRGAEQSKFPYLCFMHDDITFNTLAWGTTVINLLNDKAIGVLGVVGGLIKTCIPSDWAGNTLLVEVNIVQHYKYSQNKPNTIKSSFSGTNPAAVTVLDGLWLCVRKDVFDPIKFDSQTFAQFHGYDIDFSVAVAQHYQNLVTFDIEIIHCSEGRFDREWINSSFSLVQKWRNLLPCSAVTLSRSELQKINRLNSKILIKRFIANEFRVSKIVNSLNLLQLSPRLYVRCLAYVVRYKLKKMVTGTWLGSQLGIECL